MTESCSDNREAFDRLSRILYEAAVSGPPLPGQSYLATLAEQRIQNPESPEQTRDRHLLTMHRARLFASLLCARQRRQITG